MDHKEPFIRYNQIKSLPKIRDEIARHSINKIQCSESYLSAVRPESIRKWVKIVQKQIF